MNIPLSDIVVGSLVLGLALIAGVARSVSDHFAVKPRRRDKHAKG